MQYVQKSAVGELITVQQSLCIFSFLLTGEIKMLPYVRFKTHWSIQFHKHCHLTTYDINHFRSATTSV